MGGHPSSVCACFGRLRATGSAAFVSAFFVLAVSVVAVFGQSRAKRGPKAGLSRATAVLQKPRFESRVEFRLVLILIWVGI